MAGAMALCAHSDVAELPELLTDSVVLLTSSMGCQSRGQ
jgi:hypothetical protein